VTASSSTTPGPPTHSVSVQEYSQQIESAKQSLETAKQKVGGVAGWVDTFVKVSQPVVDDVLTKVHLVGAGFSVLALGLSATSKVAATHADQRFVREIDYISGLALLEMMKADALPSVLERFNFMKQLTVAVAGVDKASAELDGYLLQRTEKNAFDGVNLQEVHYDLVVLRVNAFTLSTSRVIVEARD
jgi:hypothetical protein